jgi:hypothetical protein
MRRGTVAPPHTQSKRARWIKAVRLFLAEQNKNRLTLEATDDLGTLIVDPMSGNVDLGGKSVRNLVLRPIRQRSRCTLQLQIASASRPTVVRAADIAADT